MEEMHNNNQPNPYPHVMGILKLAHVVDFTSYKQGQFGLWARGAGMLVTRAKLADCVVGISMPQGGQAVQDSVFVGASDNVPNEPFVEYYVDQPIIGYRSYDAGGMDLCVKSHFYNYKVSDTHQPIGAQCCL